MKLKCCVGLKKKFIGGYMGVKSILDNLYYRILMCLLKIVKIKTHKKGVLIVPPAELDETYRDWETDRKSTRLNSSHITRSRMPSSA